MSNPRPTPDPEFPDPERRNPLADGCDRCPGLVEAREEICWGVGPDDAALLVVGEAPAFGHPGAETWRGGNRTGMAYSGRRSGRKIRTMMAELGYEDVYYTNAVKCYPSAAYDPDGTATGDPHDENREPTPEERANCRPYLLREVEQVDPDCVVATGKHATRTLLAVEGRDVDGFLDLVLDVQQCPTVGAPVLPLLHPSYQEVWIGRLGHDRESYLAALDEALAEAGVEGDG